MTGKSYIGIKVTLQNVDVTNLNNVKLIIWHIYTYISGCEDSDARKSERYLMFSSFRARILYIWL